MDELIYIPSSHVEDRNQSKRLSDKRNKIPKAVKKQLEEEKNGLSHNLEVDQQKLVENQVRIQEKLRRMHELLAAKKIAEQDIYDNITVGSIKS